MGCKRLTSKTMIVKDERAPKEKIRNIKNRNHPKYFYMCCIF